MKATNPKKFVMDLGGLPINSGYADGEFFTADPESDSVLHVPGTDGEVATSVSYDARWIATIKLLETSDGNIICSSLYNLKRRGDSNIGFFPVTFRNVDTGEFLTGPDACFMRAPTLSKDRTATAREWKILIPNADYGFKL